MLYRIGCYTIFDITQTGVLNRNKPPENEDVIIWTKKRNQQANFDSIVQAISLRSQPENISKPKILEIDETNKHYFSNNYNTKKCWFFSFAVSFSSVYNDGTNELGYLYQDCKDIPMIDVNCDNLPNLTMTDLDNRNIYFVKYSDES